jgi:hypothetical protein
LIQNKKRDGEMERDGEIERRRGRIRRRRAGQMEK